MSKINKTIFIHRRDFRVTDNTSLISASKQSTEVVPIFIFTDVQLKSNIYKSDNAVKFMVESLKELNDSYGGALRFYAGDEIKIIKSLLTHNPDVGCIAFNKDYTKYSMSRDDNIEKLAKRYGVRILSEEDYALFPVGSITTGSKSVYKKFTPYYRRVMTMKPRLPDNFIVRNISSSELNGVKSFTGNLDGFHESKIDLLEKPGRKSALKLLQEIISGKWHEYDEKRDCLLYETTHLSAYNKFGCVSIREVYQAILKSKNHNSLLRQLIWRDFFYNLSAMYPHIYDTKKNGLIDAPKAWKTNDDYFKAWCDGRTGFPIVDACMRELNATGYLHNRGRLIVSNFFARILSLDWHLGERYFAQKLYDYDPTQNSFGWQVSASVSGTESRPPSQNIYNPWRQGKRFDPKAEYIKKWIPELSDVKASDIHNWQDHYDSSIYISPIVEYVR